MISFVYTLQKKICLHAHSKKQKKIYWEGWVESKFTFIYIEDVLLKYTVQHSAHLVRKFGSVCVF